jgi:hypothetical protein
MSRVSWTTPEQCVSDPASLVNPVDPFPLSAESTSSWKSTPPATPPLYLNPIRNTSPAQKPAPGLPTQMVPFFFFFIFAYPHGLSEPQAGQLRFALPDTMTFAANLLAAAAKMSTSKYFSTGGDELNTQCYQIDAPTQKQLKSTGQTLFQALSVFTAKTHAALKAQGKTPVVWEGMFIACGDLCRLTVGQRWSSTTMLRRSRKILSSWSGSRPPTPQPSHRKDTRSYMLLRTTSTSFVFVFLTFVLRAHDLTQDCGAGEWIGADPGANSWCDLSFMHVFHCQ